MLLLFPFTLIFSLEDSKPFYVIPGFVFIISKICQMVTKSEFRNVPIAFYFLLVFTLITIICNVGYTVFGTSNHLYNVGVYSFLSSFVFTLYYYLKEDILNFGNLFYIVTSIAVFIYVLHFALNGFAIGHNNSFMYNINQFAFWGFLSFIVLDILPNSIVSKTLVRILQFLLMLFVIFTLSRSATGGLIVYTLLNILVTKKRILLMLCLLVAIALFSFISHNWLIENLDLYKIYFDRFFQSREFKDFDKLLLLRGWLTIVENPIFLLFGAGEGVPSRFGHDNWIHGSVLNITFSYGVLGLYFFLKFIRNCCSKHFNSLSILTSLFISSLFTSMTHNLHLWIIIAVLLYSRENIDTLKIRKNIKNVVLTN